MTPPEGLPPLPPNTYYGGQLKDHEGQVAGFVLVESRNYWTNFFPNWDGMKGREDIESANYHIAIPLPEEDAKTGGVLHKVWVAISSTNGCALTVDDADHSGDVWPGATWKCFVPETALSAARAELAETEKAFSESQQALAVEINDVERLREENRRLREWHDLLNNPGDVPKLTGRYLVITGDGPRVVRVEERFTEFDDGTPTDPFEWSAWKEIVLPAAPESKGSPFDDPPEYHESFA